MMSEKKNHMAISEESRVENSQCRNRKDKQMINTNSTNNITELNELIYARGKLFCGEVTVLLMNTSKHSKPGWKIRLETKIKKLRQAKVLR